jgi:VCBS repeat-containing protein
MGLTVSYTKTPQAQDDTFIMSAADLTMDFDVMANDRGGNAKRLYALDNGDAASDLLVKDGTAGEERSSKGAEIWLSTDGRIAYDATCLATELAALKAGEEFHDSFTYAIQLANGTISIATARVTIVGVNDGPQAQDDANSAVEDGARVSGSVAGNDSDVDHGAVLSYALDAEVAGLVLNGDGSYEFDASNAAYQDLAEGETRAVEANYTVTDEHGAAASAKLMIMVSGTADGTPAVAVDDTVITNIEAGNPVVIPGAALLANDTGDELTITEVSDAILLESGDVAATGGSFQYSLDGGNDPATVTVETQAGMTINGTDQGEILIGGSGDDTIYGGAGDDLIIAGVGSDNLYGGAGADIFIYRAGDILPNTADVYRWDFNPGEGDRLDFRDLLAGWGLDDASKAVELGYFDFVQTQAGSQLNVDSTGGGDGMSSAIAFLGVDLSLLDLGAFTVL